MMRIAVAAVQVPYIAGGAEILADGLKTVLVEAGHHVDLITIPFRFYPERETKRAMEIWENEDFSSINSYEIDKVICLQFPTYYLKHANKIVWLIHQHKWAYELWRDDDASDSVKSPEAVSLRDNILTMDNLHIGNLSQIYTISQTVANRLKQYNRIRGICLYHPPPLLGRTYEGQQYNYIFYPSRLENLKRQHLLIEAMRHVKSPVIALIAGSGGQFGAYQELIRKYGLDHKVRLLGKIPENELIAYYANCLGVFFGPFDEDYGYVALEAMLSAKPVITCRDSGGPLEFIVHDETGFVVDPEPAAIAEAIESLVQNKKRSLDLGMAGKKRYHELDISWANVVNTLLQQSADTFVQVNDSAERASATSDTWQSYIYQPEIRCKNHHQAMEIMRRKFRERIRESAIDNISPASVQRIIQLASQKNIDFESFVIEAQDYKKWFDKADYKARYPGYYASNQIEKSLEHYLAYQLLRLSNTDVFVDLASENSPVPEIYHRLSAAKTYSQDIMYQAGINGNQIGGDACAMPVPKCFFSKALLSCSIEHFENDADTRLFHELARTLKPGGSVCVLPFYIYYEEAVQTDPVFSISADVAFDEDAAIFCAEGWGNRHARFYSPDSFKKRIIRPLENQFDFRFFYVENATAIDPSVYLRFAFTATRKAA